MDEEQAVGIVFFFDFGEARVVAPPVRLLPSASRSNCSRSRMLPGSARSRGVDPCIDECAAAAFRPSSTDGSCPGIPGYAGPWASATIARAKAVSTAGFVAVSFARGNSVGWRSGQSFIEVQFETLNTRELANNASARRCCASFSSSECGQPQRLVTPNEPGDLPPSPFHHALLGPAPGRLSKFKTGCGIKCARL